MADDPWPARLAFYPWVVVRVSCSLCKRQGQYRLARLAAAYGPEIGMEELLRELTRDCPYTPDNRKPRKYEAKCVARFPDLEGPHPPPDMPPAMAKLRVVGGKDVA